MDVRDFPDSDGWAAWIVNARMGWFLTRRRFGHDNCRNAVLERRARLQTRVPVPPPVVKKRRGQPLR